MGCGSSSAAKGQVSEPSQLDHAGLVNTSNRNINSHDPNSDDRGNDVEPSIPDGHILPQPGFIIKVVDTSPNGKKTFVNVFHHENIAGDRILSLPPVVVDDKKGEVCDAYGVTISTSRFTESEKDPNFKDKLIILILKHLKEKFLFDTTALQVRLPHIKRRYVGENIPFFPLAEHVSSVTHEAVSAEVMHDRSVTPPVETTTENTVTIEEAKDSNATLHEHAATEVSETNRIVEVSTNQEGLANNEEVDFAEELPSPFSCPPKMQGWVRKQGHVVKNWKMRYFVLNKGYLTYYADKSDNAPFGTTMKGQLCLAGFREKNMYESSHTSHLEMSITSNDLANSSGRRKSSGLFSSDPLYRIHLIYVPGQVSPENLKILYPTSDGVPSVQEFLLEATTLEEKYAWLAAISEHTAFVEQAFLNGSYPDANDFDDSAVLVNQTPSPATSGTSVQRAASVTTGQWINKHPKANQYLRPNEQIVFSGLVGKPNPVGIHLIRQLFLIVNNEVCEERPYAKRLLYLDSNTYDMKGEVLWSPSLPKIELKNGNGKYFDVLQGRSYRFYPRDSTTVEQWIEIIEQTK